jgi:hypothetical protein
MGLSRGLLRLMAAHLALAAFCLFVLGAAFFIIYEGLYVAMRTLVFYWPPAYRTFVRVSGMSNLPTMPPHAHRTWWSVGMLLLRAAWSLGFIGFGVWWLSQSGFWGQNLLHRMFR